MNFSENIQEYIIYGVAFASAGFGISYFGLNFPMIESLVFGVIGLGLGMFIGYVVDVFKSNSK